MVRDAQMMGATRNSDPAAIEMASWSSRCLRMSHLKSVGSAIYLMWFGSLAIIFAALASSYVMPLIAPCSSVLKRPASFACAGTLSLSGAHFGSAFPLNRLT